MYCDQYYEIKLINKTISHLTMRDKSSFFLQKFIMPGIITIYAVEMAPALHIYNF